MKRGAALTLSLLLTIGSGPAVEAAGRAEQATAAGSSAGAPAIGQAEEFLPTSVRQVVAAIRIIKSIGTRNRVYREARGVQRDLRGYYDARIAKAQEQLANRDQLGLEPSQVRAYERVVTRLRTERDLTLGVTEDEKKAAKYGFESALKAELLAALIRTPRAQRGLAQMRGAVEDLQGAFRQAQNALDGGNPISAVISDIESKLARVEEYAGFVGIVHGEAGARLADLTTRVRGALADVQKPIDEALAATNTVIADLDGALGDLDDQVETQRSVRGDPDVFDVAEQALQQIFAPSSNAPAEEIIAEAATQGYNRAAVRAVGAATGELDPDEFRRMRDRVRAAALGNNLERIAGICGRLTGALRRQQNQAAANGTPVPQDTTPCSLFGNPEALQGILDATRADARTSTTTSSSSPTSSSSSTTSTSSTTTTSTTTTTTSTTTTTTTAVQPTTIGFNGTMSETLDGGPMFSLLSAVNVSANIAAGGTNSVAVSLSGAGTWLTDFPCFLGDTPTTDTATVEYRFDYAATAGIDLPTVGAVPFSVTMPFSVGGNISFTLVKPFANECAELNSNPAPGIGGYGGSGQLAVTFDGQSIMVTSFWAAPDGNVTGTTTGAATVT